MRGARARGLFARVGRSYEAMDLYKNRRDWSVVPRERPLLPQVAAFALRGVMVGSSTALDGEMGAVEVVGAALRGVHMALALPDPAYPWQWATAAPREGRPCMLDCCDFVGLQATLLVPLQAV